MKQKILMFLPFLAAFAFMACQNEAGGSIAPKPSDAERLKELVNVFTMKEGDKTTDLNEIATGMKESTYTYRLDTLETVSVTITFKQNVTGTYKVKGSAGEPSSITGGVAFELGMETYNLTLKRNNETLDLILEIKPGDHSPQEKFTALVQSLTITEVDGSPSSLTNMTDDAKITQLITKTSKPVVKIILNDNVKAGKYKLSTDTQFTLIDDKKATINPDLTKQGLLARTYNFQLESDSIYGNFDFTLEINKEAKTPHDILAGLTNKLTVEDNELDGTFDEDYKISYKVKKSQKPKVYIKLNMGTKGTVKIGNEAPTAIADPPSGAYDNDVDLTTEQAQKLEIDLKSDTIYGNFKFELTIYRDPGRVNDTNVKMSIKMGASYPTIEEIKATDPLKISDNKPFVYDAITPDQAYSISFFAPTGVEMQVTMTSSSIDFQLITEKDDFYALLYKSGPKSIGATERSSEPTLPPFTVCRDQDRRPEYDALSTRKMHLIELTFTDEGATASKTFNIILKTK